jgi:hypothetical protein
MATPWALVEEWDRVWRGDEHGEAFHGPAWRTSLADLGPEAAGFRSSPATHSIAEILRHVAAWHGWALARLEGRDPGDLPDDGWVKIDRVDRSSLERLLSDLHAGRDALLQRARALDPAARDRLHAVLRFVVHHDLHHGGQVALLKSAARKEVSA